MKIRMILYVAAVSFLLSACSGYTGTAESSGDGTELEQVTPTGYPSGEVERPSIWYQEVLYLYNAGGFDLPLEEGFEKIGAVESVDNQEYPSEDFHASRLEEGQEIYARQDLPERIYVRYSQGYALFELSSDS